MFDHSLSRVAGLVVFVMMAVPASADPLRDEIAPTGKLRVAIAISTAGGAFWSTKSEAGGYAGVPVDLGKEMAAQLGVPVEYVAYDNSGQITDAAAKGIWDVTFLPQDAVRMTKMGFGPIYQVTDATYIVKAGSSVTNFQTLDQPGIKVAAEYNTTTMRGAVAHLKNAKVIEYQTYDEIFALLKNGEVDAFALSRGQLNDMAKKIPGTRVLDETFKQTVTAVAVPLDSSVGAGLREQVHDGRNLERHAAARLRQQWTEGRTDPGEISGGHAPLIRGTRRDRLHAALDDHGAGGRRGEKLDQRAAGVGLLGDAGDPR